MGKKENIQDAKNLLSMIDKRSSLINNYSPEELNGILPLINFNALKNSDKAWLYGKLQDEKIKSSLLNSISPQEPSLTTKLGQGLSDLSQITPIMSPIINDLGSFFKNINGIHHYLSDEDQMHIIRSHPNSDPNDNKKVQSMLANVDEEKLNDKDKIWLLENSTDNKRRANIWKNLNLQLKIYIIDTYPIEKTKLFAKIIQKKDAQNIALFFVSLDSKNGREAIIEGLNDKKLTSIFTDFVESGSTQKQHAIEILRQMKPQNIKLFRDGILRACNEKDENTLAEYLNFMAEKDLSLEKNDIIKLSINKNNLMDFSLKHGLNDAAKKLDKTGITVSKFPRTALIAGNVPEDIKEKIKSTYWFRYRLFQLLNSGRETPPPENSEYTTKRTTEEYKDSKNNHINGKHVSLGYNKVESISKIYEIMEEKVKKSIYSSSKEQPKPGKSILKKSNGPS